MPVMHMADAIFKALADWGSAMFPAFAQAVAPGAVAALWQGAAVAVALVLCLRFAPSVSAAHRFALWAAGFAVVAGLPLLPMFMHSSAAAPIREAAAEPLMHPLVHLDIRWAFIIAAVWLAASAFRAGELAFHALRLRRLWKAAAPVEIGVETDSMVNSRVGSRVRDTLTAVSDARRIEICTTRDLDCPSVIGFFAPRILIPEWLFSRLTPAEFEQVVLHETEHLRRRDDWTNLLQKLALVLFPLNPGLAWMERRLCREREMACDEGVVRRTQAPRAYAACLTTLAERGLQQRELLRRAHALSLGAFTRRPELVHRVHSILRRKQALNPLVAGALVGVVGFGLVIGALELSRSPQLVAFVAAPKADAEVAALAPESGPEGIKAVDAVFRSSTHFRAIETKATETAIETKAIRSASRNDAIASIAVRPLRGDEGSATVRETATTDAAVAPREIFANAAMPTRADTAAQDSEAPGQVNQGQVNLGQEFVILTTWKAVQTSSPNSRTVADYEMDASDQEQIDHADTQPASRMLNESQPDTNRGAQITFTRLIFVVYPATEVTGAQPAPATGSPSHRPVPSYGGWLFFQL
jgi:beta-lactamase regulating signal transducer with metallopeptidase domain